MAVLCGLQYESVKTNAGRERTCLLSFWVSLGVKSWDTSQLGRKGGEKPYLCRVSVLLAQEWGEKKRPSGSSTRHCHLSVWSALGVSSFSGGRIIGHCLHRDERMRVRRGACGCCCWDEGEGNSDSCCCCCQVLEVEQVYYT